MNPYEIDLPSCRSRQQRLIQVMQDKSLDCVIITQNPHLQWLAGTRFPWTFSPCAALTPDGRLTLVAPNKVPPVAAADNILTYEAKWLSTMRNDQSAASSAVLLDALSELLATASSDVAASQRRIGVEFSSLPLHLSKAIKADLVDIEPDLLRLRRRKDSDEMAMLRKAITGTARMYEVAREMIRPGVTEVEVFNALQTAAVSEYDEMLTGTGNDYQCASRGGPPRGNRPAAAGELYILDLGPAFRGYFADNARTIAVTEPSSEQQTAWEFIMQAFAHVEANARPGKNCGELFHEVQAILDESPIGVFNHHLGHGIGLFPHEGPHLNPNWDDVFEVGDIFTAEPGLYAPELQAGMRIENDYLVTEAGVENLSPFPMELHSGVQ